MSSARQLTWFAALCAAFLASELFAAESPAPILLGADVSALATGSRRGWGVHSVYQDNSKTNEEWAILLNHGWKMFRLRVFVSPVRNAPDNSLENMIPLARRIKSAGGMLLLCIHLSDTWADPQHQLIPRAWTNLDFAGLEQKVESYTHETVAQFKAGGAMPDWVQVGNEITVGTLWPLARLPGRSSTGGALDLTEETRQWDHLTRILKAGIRGVKSAAGDTPPRIAIHIDKGGNWAATKWFFDHITEAHVEYDIIAQSFYPPWRHGTLEGLRENMVRCAERYGKDFAVVETGYGRSHYENNPDMLWPVTGEGRLQFLADLINTVHNAPRGVAVMYWAPEWDLWNEDGSAAPGVSVLDALNTLTNRPASHVVFNGDP